MTEKPKATIVNPKGLGYDIDYLQHENPNKPIKAICTYDVGVLYALEEQSSYVLLCVSAFGTEGVEHAMWAGKAGQARQLAAAILRAVEIMEMPDFPPQEDIAAAMQEAMRSAKKEGVA